MILLFPRVLLLTLAFMAPAVHAQATAAAEAEPAPAPLVSLPDFTRLVESAGPAVVNIEATVGGDDDEAVAQAGPAMPDDMPEFFRRFFGQPGMPGMPGMPERGPRRGISQGTGFIISADGYVLTNHHVVEGADKVLVRLNDRRELDAEVVGSDPLSDVAINRGNSGGPLLNTRGEVVGINSQIFSNSGGYMGVSFAIPIEVAMNAVRQLRETGRVARGQLGVRIQDVQRDQLEDLGLDRPVGAFVAAVDNGSAAQKAGIEPGDVIQRFNGREVVRSAELPPMVGALAPGSKATLTVLRDGKPRQVEVTLSALALDEAQAAVVPSKSPAKAAAAPLGIEVEPLDAAARSAMGLSAGEGVLVSRVASAAARRAGLSPGDVILRVGREDVGSVADFQAAAGAIESGDPVRLLVRNQRSTGFIEFPAP